MRNTTKVEGYKKLFVEVVSTLAHVITRQTCNKIDEFKSGGYQKLDSDSDSTFSSVTSDAEENSDVAEEQYSSMRFSGGHKYQKL